MQWLKSQSKLSSWNHHHPFVEHLIYSWWHSTSSGPWTICICHLTAPHTNTKTPPLFLLFALFLYLYSYFLYWYLHLYLYSYLPSDSPSHQHQNPSPFFVFVSTFVFVFAISYVFDFLSISPWALGCKSGKVINIRGEECEGRPSQSFHLCHNWSLIDHPVGRSFLLRAIDKIPR